MRLIVLRHGPTAWNLEGRLQGRADIGLDPAGAGEVAAWRLPAGWCDLPCWVSPLRRARETAALLGHGDARIAFELIEMDWGRFEGCRLVELRRKLGAELVANEARGLDFRPPGGESPREVQDRLVPWLRCRAGDEGERAGDGQEILVVSHKGVRRALLALASGWDMRGPPPLKLANDAALILDLDRADKLRLAGSVALRGVSV